MTQTNLGSDRYAALQATQKFQPGTIGYGVHQGINALYNGRGGYRNRYSAYNRRIFSAF